MRIDNCTQVNSSLKFISFTDYENSWAYTAARRRKLKFACDNRPMRIAFINFTLQIGIVSSRIFSYVIIAICHSISFKSKSFNFALKVLCCNIPALHSVNVSQNAAGNSISRTSYYE
jgi:hypothetical protein